MNTQIKNSKKGFTLVELVVVIAILAILAAIAIPVVNSVINTASKNGALTNAQSIELAIKQCQANIAARNNEVYKGQKIKNSAGTEVTIPDIGKGAASGGYKEITVEDVALVNGIENAFKTVTYDGKDYKPYWDSSTESCVYLSDDKTDLETGSVYNNTGSCKALTGTNDAPVSGTNDTIYNNMSAAAAATFSGGSTPTAAP